MENLTVKELIKVNRNEITGVETVNARDLHEFIESSQDFSTWIKSRIEKYKFEESKDFTLHKFVVGKATKIDYHISIDMAKELGMIENNEKGKEIRKYFIKVETFVKNEMVVQLESLQNQITHLKQSQTKLISNSKIAIFAENLQTKFKEIEDYYESDEHLKKYGDPDTLRKFHKSLNTGE